MMIDNIRFLGIPLVAVFAATAGMTVLTMPGFALSTPSEAASMTGSRQDPAPQRLELAQTQTGGQAAGTASASSLPGGASSLSETYKDWQVACVQDGAAKRCVLSQLQTQQNGQRVLGIELNASGSGMVAGALVMPFGLALDSGVTFQIDDKPAMPALRFRTCMPAGCIVSVTFDAPTLVALRAGMALKLKAVADGGEAAPFSISLLGFGTALDRVGALSR